MRVNSPKQINIRFFVSCSPVLLFYTERTEATEQASTLRRRGADSGPCLSDGPCRRVLASGDFSAVLRASALKLVSYLPSPP